MTHVPLNHLQSTHPASKLVEELSTQPVELPGLLESADALNKIERWLVE